MDDASYRLRPLEDGDFDAYARLRSVLDPENPVSADRIRYWFRVEGGAGRFQRYVVCEERASREVVAVSAIWQQAGNFDPDKYWTQVSVDPAHQSRGVGRRLFRGVEETALSRRAKALWTFVKSEDLRSVRFFEQAGFLEQRRIWNSRLDLSELTPSGRTAGRAKLESEGVEFTTLAREGVDRPEVRERLYRLYEEAGSDVPRMGPVTPVTFEDFRESVFGAPGFLPEAIFLARVGKEYVAMSSLVSVPKKPDTLHIEFTGALRSYRGRGITSELKREAAESVRARGYRFLETNNDSMNAPIWAINERLGFRRSSVSILGEKALERPG